jgi:putative DNA primase/helicase
LVIEHRYRDRTTVIVHHEGRSGLPRGTSKREDLLDTIVKLKERKGLAGDNESAFEVSFTKTREFFGADARPSLLRLTTQSGKAQWSHESMPDPVGERVAELKGQGLTQKEIAEEVGLSQSQVSRILKGQAARANA